MTAQTHRFQTPLDLELFTMACEIVHLPNHDQWVYLIQKNGHSSLRLQQARDNLETYVNHDINTLEYVDVYVRNPQARYISGVNTYLQHLERQYPELDSSTALWFVKRYKFLNSHYLPQFFWLVNLSRYLNQEAKIRFRNFKDIASITQFHNTSGGKKPSKHFVDQMLDDHDLENWLYMDQILLDLQGQQLTWNQLLEHYKNNHQNPLDHALPKT